MTDQQRASDLDREAMDQAAELAAALASMPLTWQQRREADRAAAAAVGLMRYEDRRQRGAQ